MRKKRRKSAIGPAKRRATSGLTLFNGTSCTTAPLKELPGNREIQHRRCCIRLTAPYHIIHFPWGQAGGFASPPSGGLPFPSQSEFCVSYCHKAILPLPSSATMVMRTSKSNYYAILEITEAVSTFCVTERNRAWPIVEGHGAPTLGVCRKRPRRGVVIHVSF